MTTQTPWFNRSFPPLKDNGLLPSIVERLAGTPSRIAHIIQTNAKVDFTIEREGKWSVNEEIGHLLDLEDLWFDRMQDIIEDKEYLREADLENRRTHEANYNQQDLRQIAGEYESLRERLVSFLSTLDGIALYKSSFHPRLKEPMQVVDLAYFIAEHDDHHLARVRKILQMLKEEKNSHIQD